MNVHSLAAVMSRRCIARDHSRRAWKPVVSSGPQVKPRDGRQAVDDERERPPVLAAQRQQLRQAAVRAKAPVEEVDLLIQGGRPPVITEEATMQRMLERSH